MEYSNPNDYWRRQDDLYRGMSDDERLQAGCLHALFYIVAVGIAFAVCALFGSCTTTKYVPVIEHRTDTLIQTNLQHDSIYVHDSIMVSQQGDTVRIEKWHMKYVELEVHDTTYISKTDSIPKPYPVTQYVEKPLSKMEKSLIFVGIFSLMAVIVFVVWKLKNLFF